MENKTATALTILKESLESTKYREILEENKLDIGSVYERDHYFQQDNHGFHISNINWIEEQGFRIVNFPIYSPDLTLSEHFWANLKRGVNSDNPDRGSPAPPPSL